MKPEKELLFLMELRTVAEMARDHVEAIEAFAAKWIALDALSSRVHLPAGNGDIIPDHNDRTRALQAYFDEKVVVQGSIFTRVEALLGVAGRMGLILFPTGEDRHEDRRDRALHLRELLGVGSKHDIRNRLLRNKWLHYDEVLDGLEVTDVTPQRFTSSTRVTDHDRAHTVRLFLVDTLTVEYLGIGGFELRDLIAAIRDVEDRTSTALATWTSRAAEELRSSR